MICPFSEVANCIPSDCPLWVENEGCAFYVIAKSLLKKQEPPKEGNNGSSRKEASSDL